MLKKVAFGLLVLVILAAALVLPAAGRWFYFHEGTYRPPAVTRPDLRQIQVADLASVEFVDEVNPASPGKIIVDRAHENRFEMAELDVLRSRLAARGLSLEPAGTSEDLVSSLRHARGLIVISPGVDWTAAEIQAAESFVDKGGRLLLVADPTRFVMFYPDDYSVSYILDHDTVHINDLAARFGLLFGQDYLYNTSDNDGNFRNIRLTEFADNALTEDLEQVVFYAAHSITSAELSLIQATGETRSSAAEQPAERTVAVLAAEGNVLALGDLTFMTEPYNTMHDNNLLVARIADMLSQAERQYDLVDFPSFLDGRVELVYAGDPLLNDELLASGIRFQSLLAARNVDLALVDEAEGDQDTIVLGLYEQAEELEPYLAPAGVTLVMTPTTPADAEPDSDEDGDSETQAETTSQDEEADEPAAAGGRIQVGSLGKVAATGTSLLVFENQGEWQTLLVLAFTKEGLDSIVDRLAEGDLDTCLFHTAPAEPQVTVALCPTGEDVSEESGGWEKPSEATEKPEPPEEEPQTPEEQPGETGAKILILALDTGVARYEGQAGAEEYAALLEDEYEVTVWSLSADGTPRASDVLDYDLVIWTSGDFDEAVGDEEDDLLFTLMLEGVPTVLSGAYVTQAERESVQRDVEVMDTTHVLAEGFEPGQVIVFDTEEEWVVDVVEEFGQDEATDTVIMARGPASSDAGAPSVVVMDDEVSGMRLLLMAFPIYLLPDEARATWVDNLTTWAFGP